MGMVLGECLAMAAPIGISPLLEGVIREYLPIPLIWVWVFSLCWWWQSRSLLSITVLLFIYSIHFVVHQCQLHVVVHVQIPPTMVHVLWWVLCSRCGLSWSFLFDSANCQLKFANCSCCLRGGSPSQGSCLSVASWQQRSNIMPYVAECCCQWWWNSLTVFVLVWHRMDKWQVCRCCYGINCQVLVLWCPSTVKQHSSMVMVIVYAN